MDKKQANKSDVIPHVRDIIHPKTFIPSQQYFKVISWNVAGLRGLLNKNKDILTNIIQKHNPDVLCLQETKLQSSEEYENILEDYQSFWTCSIAKKGYSGNVVFIKKTIPNLYQSTKITSIEPVKKTKQMKLSASWGNSSGSSSVEASIITNSSSSSPTAQNSIIQIQNVQYELQESRFCGEGRTITVDLGLFCLVACYVPNSGQNLERLDYRVKEWDPFIQSYLTDLSKSKPVIFTGDLNVGHLDLDIHNPTAKHIVKQAGLTPVERNSMSKFLASGQFIDAFRFLYPDARGAFTYWSQRTFARPVNKGIRLDYFLCSRNLFGDVDCTTSLASSASSNCDDNNDNCQADESVSGKSKKKRKITTGENLESIDNEATLPKELTPANITNEPYPHVHDSYILQDDTVGCSDHCPVVLVLKLSP